MKLYASYISPFARHCRIILLETGLECEFIETDSASSALNSPTKKVPFFEDGEIFLTDSSAIVKYLREKAGQGFCTDATEYDRFCMVNTLLDATYLLFMLEKDGITPKQSPYLQRHEARVQSSIIELNRISWPGRAPYNDAELRLLCYLDWVKFRQRFNFDEHKNLVDFLASARSYQPFIQTVPQA